MKPYLSYFKLRFMTCLQYRSAAIAGILTQVFFAFVYIMVYLAFYESGDANAPMTLKQVINYMWLNQMFFTLIYLSYKDKDIINLIKDGNISYELARPLNVYFMWFAKILSQRISMMLLRCIPVMVLAFVLPEPYKLMLPLNFSTFLLFLLSFCISAILITGITMLFHIITMFTLDEKGTTSIIINIADIFSGQVIPLPFFPLFLQKVAILLPFRYISDFPFRIYTSHIVENEAIIGIIIQFVWLIIILIGGYLLMNKALSKTIVQGG